MIPYRDIVTALAPGFGVKVSPAPDGDPAKTSFAELYRTIDAAQFTLASVGWVGVEHTVGSADLVVTDRDGARFRLAVGLPPARVHAAHLFARALLGWATSARVEAAPPLFRLTQHDPGCIFRSEPHSGACTIVDRN